ncbi:MAG TPA: type 4a pilus biogenesis protein PilO [Gemmatimonadaceae bacterium]|nr:type 4a pilus biogenesis protein PilO [Gemmatimonadaceae bacterium]
MAGLPKGQREQGLLLVALLAVVAAVAYWLYAYQPRAKDIDAVKQRISKVQTLNHRATVELAKGDLTEIRRQLSEYQQNLVLIRTLIPTGNEVPSLLEQVSTAARRVGLDVASVDPQPVVEGENYDTYRYSMSVVGGYNELAEFFANVGNLTRIVLPVNMSLQPPANPAAAKIHKKTDEAVIEAKFQLQTFVARAPIPEPTFGGAKKGAKS